MTKSYLNNILQSVDTFVNYFVTRDVPLDTRFIVETLKSLDDEIPLSRRYNGLIFYVVADKINDGTDDIYKGRFYCFEDDLTKPIAIEELSRRYSIYQLDGYVDDYSNLIKYLNKTFAKSGSIVNIKELGIQVIYDGASWLYMNGIYKISKDDVWLTVPEILKVPGKLVISNGIDKIILEDKQLSDFVISSTTPPVKPEHGRYYLVDGFLFICLSGVLYKLTDKILYLKNQTLNVGDNIINHKFNSDYVMCFLRIYNMTGNNKEVNAINIQSDLITTDANNAIITSDIKCTCDIVMICHQKD